MTNQHSIKPPQELLENLEQLWFQGGISVADLLTKSYQAGADQELEACCEWLGDAPVVYNDNGDLHPGSYLRDARRPKPPSLKEAALALIDECTDPEGDYLDDNALSIIRRALEALPDD